MRHPHLALTALALISACSADHAAGPAAAPAPATPLLFVDGKEMTGASFRALDSLKIDHVEVVKGAAAVALYGERARNGVILVATRQTR